MRTDTPVMTPVKLDALPTTLKELDIWRNWRWLPDRENAGKFAKRPWKRGADKGGYGFNGHVLDTAETYATATASLSATTGLGIVAGAENIVILDLDYKGYTGPRLTADGRTLHPAALPLIGQPIAAAWLTLNAIESGCYAELSPSGQGIRIIVPGALPEGHSTRWSFNPDALWGTCAATLEGAREMAAGIGGETYSTRRWLTLTGNHLHGDADTAALPLTVTPGTQALLEDVQNWSTRRSSAGTAASVEIDHTLRAEYIAPEMLSGALRIFASEKLNALWNGTLEGDTSRLDYRLALTLFELLGDDAQAVNAAFITSARAGRAKWTRPTGSGTYGARTISNARAGWIAGGMKDISGQTGSAAPVTVDWSQEARDHLLFKTLNSAKGALSQRHAARRLLLDLLDLIDAGEYHVHNGELHLHSGGLAAISERIGGSTTSISARLEWYAMSGIISSYSRDAEGRPKIVMAASSAGCVALQEGLRPGCETMPCRPPSSKPRKPRVGPTAPRVARDPLPRHIQRAEWTMWMIHSGERDMETIASLTGQSVRSTRKNLADMQELKLLTDDLTPTCTRPEFRALVTQERQRNNEITRARRAEATQEYRRRMEMRNLTYNNGGCVEELSNAAD